MPFEGENFIKKLWPSSANVSGEDFSYVPNEQPHSLYHMEHPHAVRKIHGHLGAAPSSRANPYTSMDLLRHVLQSSINSDICESLNKYIEVVRRAANTTKDNFSKEPFQAEFVDADVLVSKFFDDAFDRAKKIFSDSIRCERETKIVCMTRGSPALLATGGKRSRPASPDLWNKNLQVAAWNSPTRSLSPAKKRGRLKTATVAGSNKAYNSPYRALKVDVRRKIENWDPNKLTTDTNFVMGTKANKALGLGATRGRIYMKHPELFKYSGDHDDKKWMVKNGCMAATGGKNTFIMNADDVTELYEAEYKESQGTHLEELKFFKLPNFILCKMRSAMANDKRLRVSGLPPTGRPPAWKNLESMKSQLTSTKPALS